MLKLYDHFNKPKQEAEKSKITIEAHVQSPSLPDTENSKKTAQEIQQCVISVNLATCTLGEDIDIENQKIEMQKHVSSVDLEKYNINENTPVEAYQNALDYLEGKMPTDDMYVYLGTYNKNKKYKYREDQTLDKKINDPDFLGKILHPEGRKENWTYGKNQAFIAGAIDARKTFVLVTPIRHYLNNTFPTRTKHEILWICENGYSMIKNRNNIMFRPTKYREKNSTIQDYSKIDADILHQKFSGLFESEKENLPLRIRK